MTRFLIFSGHNGRALVAFCRELTAMRAGFSIIAAGPDDPILRTTYRRQVAACRSTRALTLDDIERCLAAVRERHPADRYVVCPSSEFLNHFLLEHRAWLSERGCEVPLVDRALYQQVTNKASFRELCRQAGLPVPAIVDPDAGRFPFVAKPRVNINAAGTSLYPILMFSEADRATARERLGDGRDYYFEDYIAGPSYYLLFYFPTDPSAEVFAWSQRNILQQAQGKSMVCAVSDTLHSSPTGARVRGLLRGIGFSGLAMVEVIERGGEYFVIEMNPRLWGPLQLLRNARVDLIKAFVEDRLCGRIETADPRAGRPASYLWIGGVRDGMTWHAPKPRFPFLSLATRLSSDVHLRPDTIGIFIDELVRGPQ